MADLLNRLRNLYDDHQDRERQQARQEGYHAALYETRDALLAAALATHQQWREEVQLAGPNGNHEAIHARYAERLQGLNDAFAGHCHIKRLEPSRTLIKTGLSERAYTLNVTMPTNQSKCAVARLNGGSRFMKCWNR